MSAVSSFDLRRFVDRADWQADANCRDLDVDLFFPNGTTGWRAQAQIDEAKLVCRECDVQAECLAYAMVNDEQYGIWGGLDEQERLALRRADRRAFGGGASPDPARHPRRRHHASTSWRTTLRRLPPSSRHLSGRPQADPR